jgi:hypothetical protein
MTASPASGADSPEPRGEAQAKTEAAAGTKATAKPDADGPASATPTNETAASATPGNATPASGTAAGATSMSATVGGATPASGSAASTTPTSATAASTTPGDKTAAGSTPANKTAASTTAASATPASERTSTDTAAGSSDKTPATSAKAESTHPDPARPDATRPGATRPGATHPDSTAGAAAGAPSGGEAAGKTKPPGEATNNTTAADKAGDTKTSEQEKSDKQGKPDDKDKPGDKAKEGDKDKPDATAGKDKDKDGTESKTGDKTGDKTDKVDGKAAAATAAPTAAAVAAASKGRATRALRRANPVRVARSTARSTSAWAKRPSGRLILPAIIAILLLGAAGTAGALLVPQALQSVPSPSATPGFGADANASAGSGPAGPLPSLGSFPSASAPFNGGTVPGTAPPGGGAIGGARPSDALAAWAQDTGTRAAIPVVAVQAYGYAELVVARTNPTCHLNWTTIAALAKVESQHGSANGAVLNVDGSVVPPIRGLPLDGKGGRLEIRDTDQGALDGDVQFDRALGPLQFLPQTWSAISVGNGVDADSNGVSDPNDMDDAALAAARYLCQGGRDLAKPDAWWEAILSYNAVRPYAQNVFDAANDYGLRTRV